MKNYHNENKFVLVSNTEPKTLAVESKDFSYLEVEGCPIFISRAKLYLALSFTLKYPFVYVDDSIEFDEELSFTRRFIS